MDELDVDGDGVERFWEKVFVVEGSGEKDTALTKNLATGTSAKINEKALAGLIRGLPLGNEANPARSEQTQGQREWE